MNGLHRETETVRAICQMVHDCRQPLTRASGLLSLALPMHPQAADDLRPAQEALFQLARMLEDMLKVLPKDEVSGLWSGRGGGLGTRD